jgi:hypothetical protein
MMHEAMNPRIDTHATEIKTVGRTGEISLGKRYAGKTLRLERFKDGPIVLTAVALVPESHLWTLAEPDRSRIERGVDWATKTSTAETDIDALLKRQARKAPRQSARRR